MSEIVRRTAVQTDDRNLQVSTVKIAPRYYDTVVFDESADKRHAGKRVGRYVIDHLNIRTETREEAMDIHRAALQAARTEPIRELAG